MNDWNIHNVQRKCTLLKMIYSSNQKRSLEEVRRQCKETCVWRKGAEVLGEKSRGWRMSEAQIWPRDRTGLTRTYWKETHVAAAELRFSFEVKKDRINPAENQISDLHRNLRRSPRMQNMMKFYKEMRYKNIKYKTSSWSQRRPLVMGRNDIACFRQNQ